MTMDTKKRKPLFSMNFSGIIKTLQVYINNNISPTFSFPYAHDWAGSTIELTPDLGSGPRTSSSDGLRRSLNRVMEKNGKENVVFRRIPEKSWRYMRDLVTTLVRSWFGHRKTSTPRADQSRSDVYSITPSIQRRLDELANEPPHLSPHFSKSNPNQNERVTFSI